MIKRYDVKFGDDDYCGCEITDSDSGEWVTYEDHEREAKELELRAEVAESEFARVCALPDLEWATARSSILQRFAALSRAGYQSDGQVMLDLVDKASVYVSRLKLRADECERRVRWLESVLLKADDAAWSGDPHDCADVVAEVVLTCQSSTGGEERVKQTPEDFK